MKYLIVGLGNPGAEYENTRHNIGFKVLDALNEASDTFFTTEKNASISSIKYKGRTLHLAKPTTFMNLSGKAVNYWLQKHKVDINNLFATYNELKSDNPESSDFKKHLIPGDFNDFKKEVNQSKNNCLEELLGTDLNADSKLRRFFLTDTDFCF